MKFIVFMLWINLIMIQILAISTVHVVKEQKNRIDKLEAATQAARVESK